MKAVQDEDACNQLVIDKPVEKSALENPGIVGQLEDSLQRGAVELHEQPDEILGSFGQSRISDLAHLLDKFGDSLCDPTCIERWPGARLGRRVHGPDRCLDRLGRDPIGDRHASPSIAGE
jgi:hypothetical protein